MCYLNIPGLNLNSILSFFSLTKRIDARRPSTIPPDLAHPVVFLRDETYRTTSNIPPDLAHPVVFLADEASHDVPLLRLLLRVFSDTGRVSSDTGRSTRKFSPSFIQISYAASKLEL